MQESDQAYCHLYSLEQVNTTGGEREGGAECRTGSDVTIGPEGRERGSRSEGAVVDSSKRDKFASRDKEKKLLEKVCAGRGGGFSPAACTG